MIWLIHTCDMTNSHAWHDSFIDVTCLIHMCDMTHAHVWHDWFTRMTWLIHRYDMSHSHVWCDSFTRVTRPIRCDMTPSYVCHDSLIHMCDMTYSFVWHDWFISMTWLMHMCDMTHPHRYFLGTGDLNIESRLKGTRFRPANKIFFTKALAIWRPQICIIWSLKDLQAL